MSSSVATSDDGRTRKPPRLPLLDLQASHHATRYQNELYLNRGGAGGGIGEEDDAENFLDAQSGCTPSELQFKNVNEVFAKDERALQLELKCLLSLQKKKDRTLSSMLLGSNDFLSPRSGCLTPLSSSRGRLGSARSISLERYKLYLTEGDFFLLSARKRKKSKTSNYVISLDEEDISYKTANYFGNVRSNFLGTKFWFYDKGDPPTIMKNKFCYNRPTDRVELGAVLYEANVFWMRGPRKITAIIPSIDADDKQYIFQPHFGSLPSILHSFKNGFDNDKMVILKNKLPEWNKKLMSYCLNFNGRAPLASSKNFQLVTEVDNDNVVLQLGKVGKNNFTMDYQYPMSALQAFAICLSSLDHRLT